VSPDVDLAVAITQIYNLEPKSPMSDLFELVVVRRASSSPPCRRCSFLGEPPCSPSRARVSSPDSPVGGRRRPGAVDHDLIERPRKPHTPSTPGAADGRAPLVNRYGLLSHVLWARSRLAQHYAGRTRLDRAHYFFLRIIYLFP
jgi:hypothetical protein